MTDTQVFLGLKIAGEKRSEHPSVRMAEPLKCGAGKEIGSLSRSRKFQKFWGFFVIALNFALTSFQQSAKMSKKEFKKSGKIKKALPFRKQNIYK